MKKIVMAILLSLVAPVAWAKCSGGGSHTLSDGNMSTVTNCLNSVNTDNTTIIIPAGTWNWNAQQTFTQNYSVTIQGAGTSTGSDSTGSPTGYNDQTTICNTATNTVAIWTWNTKSGKTFRVTGISIGAGPPLCPSNSNPAYNGTIQLLGQSHSVRFDHNHVFSNFGTNGSKGLYVNSVWGVIDHNVFDDVGGPPTGGPFNNVNHLELNDGFWNNSGEVYGHGSWADASNFGTNNFIFIENNYIHGFGTAFDCQSGGRFVFRYNTVQGMATQLHGTGHAGTLADRSCRAFEFYKNNLNGTAAISGNMIDYEGGTSLWWGNIISNYSTFIRPFYRRYCSQSAYPNSCTYDQTPPPNGWGYSGTFQTGSTSTWDQNSITQNGYAVLDGTGRGKGDLLTGGFPSTANSALGGQTWPRQARDPVYAWGQNSTIGSAAYWVNWVNGPVTDTSQVENRDYFLELPNNTETGAVWNGTAGIGCGAGGSAGASSSICPHPQAQTATCSNASQGTYPGPGYWNTVNNTLYVCTAPNTWTSYYSPYTYPHPLVTGGGGGGGGSGLTWGSVDVWMQMNNSSAGTTPSSAILAAGVVGNPLPSWTVSPKRELRSGPGEPALERLFQLLRLPHTRHALPSAAVRTGAASN